MQVTRDKRVLALGVQPVIKNVEPSADMRNMLSADARIRGNLINLKKILQPFLNDKLKALGLKLQVVNAVLMYGGIDATNYHFSNKPMHTPFIEFILCRLDASKPADLEKARSEIVLPALVGELEEALEGLARDETCIVTREILRKCKTSAKGAFEVHRDSSDRVSIDFAREHPFVEIRTMFDLRVSVLEKYGTYFLPLGAVLADVKTGLARYGGADWKFREATLRQCLERSGLTWSFWTFSGLVRRVVPMLTMRKMGMEESVRALVEETCLNAPTHNGGAVHELRNRLLAELADWKNDKLLASILTFDEFYNRLSLLGFMPEDRELRNNLNNTYNSTHLREVRISVLPK